MADEPNDESASGKGNRWVLVLALVAGIGVLVYFVLPLVASGSPERRLVECVKARDNSDALARWLHRCP
jgi:hypothetical protein